jgi:hypothetical protein
VQVNPPGDRFLLFNQFKSLVTQAIIDRGSNSLDDVPGGGAVRPGAMK